ncbi:MAG TPA: PilZ domain-containing protein [Candidatus Sulfotelmatobacter sp.]
MSFPSELPAPQRGRADHRHLLRTLTYISLDGANGGIIRNLNRHGVAVHAVAPLRPGQNVRLRFELRYPRLPIQARGEVLWANSLGQSGIRFLDLPPGTVQQLNAWILGDLLANIPQPSEPVGELFRAAPELIEGWSHPVGVESPSTSSSQIRLPERELDPAPSPTQYDSPVWRALDLAWLTRPLSGAALALAIDTLIVFAAILLFFVVFFSVSEAFPEWPMNLALGAAVAIFVATFYWGFFHTMAGTTLGSSLARLTDSSFDANREKRARFR